MPSSKISFKSERPKSENERRCTTCGMPFIGGFERDGDLLLDLLGGDAGPLGDDLDVIVGHVGVGLDGKIVEGNDAPDEQEEGKAEDEQAIVEGEIDDAANHLLFHRVLQIEGVGDDLVAGLMPGDDLPAGLPGSMFAGRRLPRA